ncbi:MAG: hypothetical protein KGO83_06965 [Paenibacillaceae bacterium]|nr:hypothetical protein [Paenibacillaceae bacterium]
MYRLFRARRWVASGIMLSILMMNVMSYGGPLLHTAEASTKEDYAALAKIYKDCMNIPLNNTPKFNGIDFSKINPTSIGSSGDAKLLQTEVHPTKINENLFGEISINKTDLDKSKVLKQ